MAYGLDLACQAISFGPWVVTYQFSLCSLAHGLPQLCVHNTKPCSFLQGKHMLSCYPRLQDGPDPRPACREVVVGGEMVALVGSDGGEWW